jgi:hypothetical protein
VLRRIDQQLPSRLDACQIYPSDVPCTGGLSPASSRPFRQTATVLSIVDGDTMRVVDAGKVAPRSSALAQVERPSPPGRNTPTASLGRPMASTTSSLCPRQQQAQLLSHSALNALNALNARDGAASRQAI